MFSRSTTVALLYVGVIAAYPLLAAVFGVLGTETAATPSIVLRIIVALLGVLVIVQGFESIKIRNPAFVAAYVVFWLLYLYRLTVDAYINEIDLSFPPLQLYGYVLLFAILPSLGGLTGLNLKSSDRAFRFVMAVSFAAVCLMLIQAGSIVDDLAIDGTKRFSLEKLNPISVGMMGSTLVLLAICGLFDRKLVVALMRRIFYIVCLVLGIVALVIAASRGPILATVGAFAVFAIAPMRSSRLLGTGLVLALAGAAAYMVYQYTAGELSIDVVERFRSAAQGYDTSALSREETFAGAFNQFLANPVLGDSFVEKTYNFYPHNLILEALMATGIIGGGAYLLAIAMSAIAALKLIARRDGYEWLSMIYFQSLILAQFSGAHWSSGPHWLTMVAVVVTEHKSRRVPRRRPMPAPMPAQMPEAFAGEAADELPEDAPVERPRHAAAPKNFPAFSTGPAVARKESDEPAARPDHEPDSNPNSHPDSNPDARNGQA